MSTNRRIYLDFNATAPLGEPARAAMVEALAEVGNPSSVHAEGRRARDRVERARRQVAALVRRPHEQIVFTSGGTEANLLGVLALAKVAEQRGLPRVLAASPLDHPSLLGAVAELHRRGWVTGDAPSLVVASAANHELGTTLPAAAWNALVHIDAVQAVGKLDLAAFAGADSIAVSAHKLGGPQGIGALAIAVDAGLPLVEGGHQERGRRPGTENTLGIVGFGAAAAAIEVATWARVTALGDRLERGLLAIDGVRINGAEGPRVGGTINAGFSGALGEAIVMALDLAGIAVSTGAACTSGSVQPSPVLLALGQSPAQAREAVRFSPGRTTTADEIDEVLRVLPAIVERARKHR